MRLIQIFLCAATTFLSSTTVMAAWIYENQLSNTLSGYASNDPSAVSSQQMADDFIFVSSQMIASITWYGNYVNDQFGEGHLSDFTLRLFEDIGNGTSPVNAAPFYSADVYAIAQSTGVTSIDGHDILLYTANLPSPVSLASGTYWLSVVESDPLTNFETWEWASTASGGGAINVRRLPPTTPNWITVGSDARRNRAFILDNAAQQLPSSVPVPSTVLLLGTGFFTLVAVKRKYKTLV